MLDKPSINRLHGDRLQLRHGSMVIQLKVWAAPDVVRQAHRLVTRHFPKIMPELEDDLDALSVVSTGSGKFQGQTAQRMADAVAQFDSTTVTPMAVIRGSIAEDVLRIINAAGTIERAYVNNGGDFAFYLADGQVLIFGAAGDAPEVGGWPLATPAKITAAMRIGGIAVAGTAASNRALSPGIAERVIVFAASASQASAAAAVLAHTATVESKAITRKPAAKIDPDCGLGDLMVTTKVGQLLSAEIDAALASGVAAAETMIANGQIGGAVFVLQDSMRSVGVASQL